MIESIFEVNIPTSFLQFGFDKEEIQKRVTEWIVISLFIEERISSGKAARLLNMERLEFIELLKKRGIAYINYSTSDLEEDFLAAKLLDKS